MTKVDLINEEFKLVAHRIIARLIKLDPSLLEKARKKISTMEENHGEVDFILEWKEILSRESIFDIQKELTSRDDDNYRLRISSPFNTMSFPPFNSEAYRRRIWKAAKRLVEDRLNRLEGDKLCHDHQFGPR